MLITKEARDLLNKRLKEKGKKALVLKILLQGPTGRELHFDLTNDDNNLRLVDGVCLEINDEDLNTLYELGVMFECDESNKLIVTKKGVTCSKSGTCKCDGTKTTCECVKEVKS